MSPFTSPYFLYTRLYTCKIIKHIVCILSVQFNFCCAESVGNNLDLLRMIFNNVSLRENDYFLFAFLHLFLYFIYLKVK